MDFIRSIKENLKDPKKKSLTLLGLYFIFFIFVFIVLSSSNSSSNYTPPIDEGNKDSISSYEYIYKINNNNILLEVIGTYKDSEDIFSYNGLNYYKKENNIYLNNSELTKVDNLDFDIDKFKYNNIELLINNSNLISETKYNDNNKKINYEIVMDRYFNITGDINVCDTIDCTKTSTIVLESNEYMHHVVIDLSNFYGYTYNIDITYSNVNNIQELKPSTN